MKKNSKKYRKMKKLKKQRKIEWIPIGWSMIPVDVTDMNEEEKAEAIKEANKLSRGIIS